MLHLIKGLQKENNKIVYRIKKKYHYVTSQLFNKSAPKGNIKTG